MFTAVILRPRFVYLTCAALSLLLMTETTVWAAKTERLTTGLTNDETTFVYAGKCETNEPYRLVAYQKSMSGVNQSFYDYEGPNGKGTVRTETAPKVMAARVCRKMAEIINANYWE